MGTPARDSETVTHPEGRRINSGGDGGVTARPAAREVGEADRERAAAALREFLEENATSVERAARMRNQAERLEREGTPSDSARIRAERAREEVVDGLSRLRRALHTAGEAAAARALDLEVTKLNPPVEPGEIRR